MTRLFFVFTALSLSCASPTRATVAPSPAPPRAEMDRVEVELIETAPVETTLDHPDVRDAGPVWVEMIDRAKKTIALSHFYASDAETPIPPQTRLTLAIAALERAAKRGVRIRFIADKAFAPKYPTTIDALKKLGVDVRILDSSTRYGGVQHAKYMIVDGEEVFVGSQNFDWRALEHIQEMGVRVRSPVIAGSLSDVFETDWTLAAEDARADLRTRTHLGTLPDVKARSGEAVGLYASPRGWLPDESRWEIPRMVALLDGAKKSIGIQVLLYSTHNRDKTEFLTLDDAVKRAAARGVKVRLLVSHWGANPGSANRKTIEGLAQVANVEVKVLTIPPWSGGEIPFARVAHAKYMVVDDQAAWIGTSNWEGDYFLKSRDVSIVLEGGPLPPRLARIFDDGWTSSYASPLE